MSNKLVYILLGVLWPLSIICALFIGREFSKTKYVVRR